MTKGLDFSHANFKSTRNEVQTILKMDLLSVDIQKPLPILRECSVVYSFLGLAFRLFLFFPSLYSKLRLFLHWAGLSRFKQINSAKVHSSLQLTHCSISNVLLMWERNRRQFLWISSRARHVAVHLTELPPSSICTRRISWFLKLMCTHLVQQILGGLRFWFYFPLQCS